MNFLYEGVCEKDAEVNVSSKKAGNEFEGKLYNEQPLRLFSS
jgi:hypothetical protein